MRGDGVGVGDIGEVQGDARSPRDSAAADYSRGAGEEQDAGVVGGRGAAGVRPRRVRAAAPAEAGGARPRPGPLHD